MRESEKINIKMYENEIEREIDSPNMEYKSKKYYNREWKESLINDGFCELVKIWLNITFGELNGMLLLRSSLLWVLFFFFLFYALFLSLRVMYFSLPLPLSLFLILSVFFSSSFFEDSLNQTLFCECFSFLRSLSWVCEFCISLSLYLYFFFLPLPLRTRSIKLYFMSVDGAIRCDFSSLARL
jgi:hypothetical protein